MPRGPITSRPRIKDTDPGYLSSSKKYYHSHKELVASKAKIYYEKNKEAILLQKRTKYQAEKRQRAIEAESALMYTNTTTPT